MKIAVLGCGNMSSMVTEGLKSSEPSLEFICWTPTQTRAKALAEKLDGKWVSQLSEIGKVDAYLIGCKPQQFTDLARELKPFLNSHDVIISMMAGLRISTIQKVLEIKNVIRFMPSLPIKFQRGVIPYLSSFDAPFWETAFQNLGLFIKLNNESELDVITPYTGCVPAFYFDLIRMLGDSLKERMPHLENAEEIVKESFSASALLFDEVQTPAKEMRDKVTSQKGVTITVLESLRDHQIQKIWDKSIDKGINRSIELSQN